MANSFKTTFLIIMSCLFVTIDSQLQFQSTPSALPHTIISSQPTSVAPAIPQALPVAVTSSVLTVDNTSFSSSGVTIQSTQDLNCKLKSVTSGCLQCYQGYYYDTIKKQCATVNPLCKTWNIHGQCLSCYSGYFLVAVLCQQNPAPVFLGDPNCYLFNNITGKCQQCSFKYVFNKDGVCTAVSPDCQTWNSAGNCLSCYDGFILNGTTCIKPQATQASTSQVTIITSPPAASIMPISSSTKQIQNCAEYNDQGQCIKCSFRYFYSSLSVACLPVSDLCKSWSLIDGTCQDCYSGYDLFGGKCVLNDPFCTIKTQQNQCVQCINRFYLNQKSICTAVNPFCKNYNFFNGQCTDCFDGYALKEGKCINS